jgi:glycosyltransferase involved in cell wall biosynthesis
MKITVLHAYPPEPDGLSIQGNLLYKGLKELKDELGIEEVVPCHFKPSFQKQWVLSAFKPDIAIGIGSWSFSPDIVFSPQRAGILPIPWFVANGWVANYHKELSELPLTLATSHWVKETFARDGVDTKNFEVLPIGFDPKEVRYIPQTNPEIQRLRAMLGIQPEEKMILTVGGDVTSKGAQEMFKALKIVNEEFKNWKYVIKMSESDCADGHMAEEEELIDSLGLDRGRIIRLEGMYSHDFMSQLFSACDIYAAPSRLEGFGMIQMEANACGKPVISINVGGPVDTIIHGQTGFLAEVSETVELKEEWAYDHMGFDSDHKIVFDKPKVFAYRASVPDLAKYTLQLLTDDKLREEMGRNGIEHTAKNYHYQTIARKAMEIIRRKTNIQ